MNDLDYTYDVIKLSNPKCQYLVMANTSECVVDAISMNDFPDLVNGTIVVDMLLYEGFEDNRFATIPVRNGKLMRQEAKYTPDVDPEIEFECTKYYAFNSGLITYSSLIDDEKVFIFHQIKKYFCTSYA